MIMLTIRHQLQLLQKHYYFAMGEGKGRTESYNKDQPIESFIFAKKIASILYLWGSIVPTYTNH